MFSQRDASCHGGLSRASSEVRRRARVRKVSASPNRLLSLSSIIINGAVTTHLTDDVSTSPASRQAAPCERVRFTNWQPLLRPRSATHARATARPSGVPARVCQSPRGPKPRPSRAPGIVVTASHADCRGQSLGTRMICRATHSAGRGSPNSSRDSAARTPTLLPAKSTPITGASR